MASVPAKQTVIHPSNGRLSVIYEIFDKPPPVPIQRLTCFDYHKLTYDTRNVTTVVMSTTSASIDNGNKTKTTIQLNLEDADLVDLSGYTLDSEFIRHYAELGVIYIGRHGEGQRMLQFFGRRTGGWKRLYVYFHDRLQCEGR